MPDPMIGKPEKVEMGKLRQPKQAENKLMQSPEIIQKSAEKEIPGTDMTRFMQTLGYMVEKKMVQLLQIGNTVFMLKPQGDGSVEFHTFTVESPSDLVERYKAGINSLKEMGFKKAFSYATSPAFVKIAEQTGLPVRTTQTQTMQGNQMVPAYRFEVDI
jgi:hypothetical protein